MSSAGLRIVFMGSPDFAVPSLERLHASRHKVVAVVSGTDKKRGRGGELSPTEVKTAALELGLPVIAQDDMNDPEFATNLESLDADLFVVVAFKVLPPSLLKIPRLGSINVHASLLPKYRGAAPIHRAVMNGDTETGVTVFFLDEKVDTGKYIIQKRIPIEEDDTTGSVYERLMHVGADVLLRAVDRISDGNYELTVQNDDQATKAPKVFASEGILDASRSVTELYNLIRGFNPFPSAWLLVDGKKLKVHRSRILSKGGPCGSSLTEGVDGSGENSVLNASGLHSFGGKLLFSCKDGCLELCEVQLEGRGRVSGEQFVRGYNGPLRLS